MADASLCDQKACNSFIKKLEILKLPPGLSSDFLDKICKAQSTTISDRELLHGKGSNQ